MIDLYIESVKEKKKYEEIKEEIIFGLLGGIILILIGFLGYLKNMGIKEIAYIVLFILGNIFVFTAVIIPTLLSVPCKCFYKLGDVIGKTIFTILLCVIYFVMVIPVGIIMKRKRNEFEFYEWDDKYNLKSIGFIKRDRNILDLSESCTLHEKKGGILFNVYKIVGYFVYNKRYIMLPTLIIILVLGLILFFVSSTVVAPFIYTLF